MRKIKECQGRERAGKKRSRGEWWRVRAEEQRNMGERRARMGGGEFTVKSDIHIIPALMLADCI